jgi:hypothetical protein
MVLSIGNFMLMIKNHFARFQLPGNLLKTKKCAPYFRGNTQFPIYWKFLKFPLRFPEKFRIFWEKCQKFIKVRPDTS